MKFLGSIRPERLLLIADSVWEGHATKSRTATPAVVQTVTHIGEREVWKIATGTGTLIADGYLLHT